MQVLLKTLDLLLLRLKTGLHFEGAMRQHLLCLLQVLDLELLLKQFVLLLLEVLRSFHFLLV